METQKLEFGWKCEKKVTEMKSNRNKLQAVYWWWCLRWRDNTMWILETFAPATGLLGLDRSGTMLIDLCCFPTRQTNKHLYKLHRLIRLTGSTIESIVVVVVVRTKAFINLFCRSFIFSRGIIIIINNNLRHGRFWISFTICALIRWLPIEEMRWPNSPRVRRWSFCIIAGSPFAALSTAGEFNRLIRFIPHWLWMSK